MRKKQITIKAVRAKIEEMSGSTLAQCHLTCEAHWSYNIYWLVFTEEDVHDRLRFDKIHEVWDWLVAFERDHPQDTVTA